MDCFLDPTVSWFPRSSVRIQTLMLSVAIGMARARDAKRPAVRSRGHFRSLSPLIEENDRLRGQDEFVRIGIFQHRENVQDKSLHCFSTIKVP